MNPNPPSLEDVREAANNMALYMDIASIIALLAMVSLIIWLPVIAFFMRHIAFHLRNLSAERR